MICDRCHAVAEEAASWADLLGPPASVLPAAKDATAKPLSNRARRAALKKHNAAAAAAAADAAAPLGPGHAASDVRSPSIAATAIADSVAANDTVTTAAPVTTGTASVAVDTTSRASTQRPSAGTLTTSADFEGIRTPESAGGQPVGGLQRGTQAAKGAESLGTSGVRAPAGGPNADPGSGPQSAEGPFSAATPEQQPPRGTAQAAEAAERKRKAKDMMSLLGF